MFLLRSLLAACAIFGTYLTQTAPASAQTPINWPAGNYSPNTLAEMNNNRWGGYDLPNNTRLWTNVWGPLNSSGNRTDAAGWQMPMRQWVRIFDTTRRHWHVEYDVVGAIPQGSPYRHPTASQSWVKSYPHIQYKPEGLYVWQGDTKVFRSEWHLGAESTDWANNRFNAIYEIRLARHDSAGAVIPGTDYIIQIEIMQARYGNPAPASVSLSGYTWTPGLFHTFNGVPVHKFILSGAGVTQNTARSVSLDLFPFMQYTANRPARYTWDAERQVNVLVPGTYPRASWNARVRELNAGVEVCLGTNSKVWTSLYWGSAWNR